MTTAKRQKTATARRPRPKNDKKARQGARVGDTTATLPSDRIAAVMRSRPVNRGSVSYQIRSQIRVVLRAARELGISEKAEESARELGFLGDDKERELDPLDQALAGVDAIFGEGPPPRVSRSVASKGKRAIEKRSAAPNGDERGQSATRRRPTKENGK